MKEQKKYHQRKLAIIEMIEEVDRRILNEREFMKQFDHYNFQIDNSLNNISRLNRIGAYLTIRYHK